MNTASHKLWSRMADGIDGFRKRTFPPKGSELHPTRLRREVRTRLANQANIAVDRVAIFTPSSIAIFLLLFWHQSSHARLALWALSVATMVAVQMWMRRPRRVVGPHDAPVFERPEWPEKQLAIAGFAWGTFAWAAVSASTSDAWRCMVALVITSLLASSTIFAASSKRLFFHFQIPLFVTATSRIVLGGGWFGAFLGIYLTYCFLVSIFLNGEVHALILASIRREFDNEQLAIELEAKRQGLEVRNSELGSANSQLASQALSDQLTGLANRRVFRRDLEDALRSLSSDNQLAVVFLDVDRFKQVNDALGHELADELLIEVARRISASVRPCDLVARNGGDEFTILLQKIDGADEVVHVAERIRLAIADGVELDGRTWETSASIGVAIAKNPTNVSTLMREADAALLLAKEGGRNRVEVFNGDLLGAAEKQKARRFELRQALKNNEIVGWVQPEISLVDGTMRRAELLARWKHTTKGVLGADSFMHDIETHRLIPQLSDATIEFAVQTLRKLEPYVDSGFQLHINVSAHTIGQHDWIERLLERLRWANINPNQIAIEITETAIIENLERASKWLQRARDAGMTVFLDDFGVGYSSLAMLTKLPVDGLKIDRSFVWEAATSSTAFAVIKATSSMAADLGLIVVAEGIELQEQAEMLLGLGILHGQGYLFSPAVPVEEIASWNINGVPWRDRYLARTLAQSRT